MSFIVNSDYMSSEIKKIIVMGSKSQTVLDNDILNNSSISYQIILKENSHFELCIALLQANSLIFEVEIDAQGDNSSCDIIFLYALSSDQQVKIITKQKHTGKQTISRLFARGIVKDRAQVHHEGLIFIDSQAKQADAVLNHTTIVLDGKSQVILIPSIEVLNYDVQCSHGAAVGQFDKEHLWYLQTRGFNEKQAYDILARSFFGEFIEKFDQAQNLLESLCQKIV
jgi:Fe-S cluster assembly protein SufD